MNELIKLKIRTDLICKSKVSKFPTKRKLFTKLEKTILEISLFFERTE